jgi:hypothetical protein
MMAGHLTAGKITVPKLATPGRRTDFAWVQQTSTNKANWEGGGLKQYGEKVTMSLNQSLSLTFSLITFMLLFIELSVSVCRIKPSF